MGHTMNVTKDKMEFKGIGEKKAKFLSRGNYLKSCSSMKGHCFSWGCLTNRSPTPALLQPLPPHQIEKDCPGFTAPVFITDKIKLILFNIDQHNSWRYYPKNAVKMTSFFMIEWHLTKDAIGVLHIYQQSTFQVMLNFFVLKQQGNIYTSYFQGAFKHLARIKTVNLLLLLMGVFSYHAIILDCWHLPTHKFVSYLVSIFHTSFLS